MIKMWKIKGKNLTMNLGDFGLPLPINITNVLETDVIKFEIYKNDGTNLLEKNLNYSNEKWVLELNKEETQILKKEEYLYAIKQYRDETLQNTINKDSEFIVD